MKQVVVDDRMLQYYEVDRSPVKYSNNKEEDNGSTVYETDSSSSTCSLSLDDKSIEEEDNSDLETCSLLPESNGDNDDEDDDDKKRVKLGNNSNNKSDQQQAAPPPLSDGVKLLIGAGGIYAAFLYYGSLQEDVFRYQSPVDGTSFTQAWFLSVLEAMANVIVGYIGMNAAGSTPNLPLNLFAISGAAQVTSKACTCLALTHGLSYPVALLAKSSKMAPVMAGSLLLDGTIYSLREYVQVLAIIGGTLLVSLGKKKSHGGGSSSSSISSGDEHSNSWMGVVFIVLSLVASGVTAGFQKRIQTQTAKKAHNQQPKPYDFMFWTNVFMMVTAGFITLLLGELKTGIAFCIANPSIFSKIVQFSICSAVGQSFLFYTLANFDPLVLSTVTTSRKILSVLISILFKGNKLNMFGCIGIMLACGGIISEFVGVARKQVQRKKLPSSKRIKPHQNNETMICV